MVRVSLKNTFLSFDENDEECEEVLQHAVLRKVPSPKQAASPRSRSVECPSPHRDCEDRPEGVQIEKLNELLGTALLPTPIRSPLQCSPARSASPVPGAKTCHTQDAIVQGSPQPDALNSGPSAQELKQLQRRLEEVCAPRGRHSSITSIGSISSVEDLELRESGERVLPTNGLLHQVWSSASVSTLASGEPLEEEPPEYGAAVEFDLTIEEVPGHNCSEPTQKAPFDLRTPGLQQPGLQPTRQNGQQRGLSPNQGGQPLQLQEARNHSPGPVAVGPLQQGTGSMQQDMHPQRLVQQRQMTQLAGQRRSNGQASPQQPRSPLDGSQGGSPSLAPASAPLAEAKPSQQVAMMSGEAAQNMVPWHKRQWPKEYRHGHVPKNLNLEEEYKHGRDAAPTTLMIRNIPNHYTQRQLINELDDLGFKGTFDFLYIPLDKGTMSNVGYAFVNFVEPEWAERCMAAFQNYRFKRHRKIAAVSVAHIQGLEANLAHYENAAVNTAKLKQRRPVIMANISQTLSSALDLDD